MSLNSFATPDRLEIGRAQAVQADACGIDCSSDMNPVLLKPTSYLSSQVILKGKPVGNRTASEYFMETDRDMLFQTAMKAYDRLSAEYNPVVIKGAGSISEMNLWDIDITNMRVALKARAAVFLISDIDKGGVIGSIICGRFQMMGREIHDPYHVEGDTEFIPGLGLLPVSTTLTNEKTTEQRTFRFLNYTAPCRGYEIHMGETMCDDVSPLCRIEGGTHDGYFLDPKTWGTYLHGIFDNTAIINYILSHNSSIKDIAVKDYTAFKEEQYNKLAKLIRDNVDMGYVYGILRQP